MPEPAKPVPLKAHPAIRLASTKPPSARRHSWLGVMSLATKSSTLPSAS